VLSAIPLLVGEFGTDDIARVLQSLGQGVPSISSFGLIGIHFSFWIALIAFGLTIWAIIRTLRRDDSDGTDQAGPVNRVDQLSRNIFDGYREIEHLQTRTAISTIQRAVQQGHRLGSGDGNPGLQSRELVHKLDQSLCQALAQALDQCNQWSAVSPVPTSDEQWAEYLETSICRFVLLSDIYDLRPESLRLPCTLGLYRHAHRMDGIRVSLVSDQEYQWIMQLFGYTEDEIQAIEQWSAEAAEAATTAVEFVNVFSEKGINALHETELRLETAEASG